MISLVISNCSYLLFSNHYHLSFSIVAIIITTTMPGRQVRLQSKPKLSIYQSLFISYCKILSFIIHSYHCLSLLLKLLLLPCQTATFDYRVFPSSQSINLFLFHIVYIIRYVHLFLSLFIIIVKKFTTTMPGRHVRQQSSPMLSICQSLSPRKQIQFSLE